MVCLKSRVTGQAPSSMTRPDSSNGLSCRPVTPCSWPNMKGTGEFGEKMNTMTKYVVSSTLNKVDWPGSKLVKGDLAEEIRRLKREPGHDLLLSGSARLFNALMKENLIDLYRFMLHPVVLGSGKRLFTESNAWRVLDLAETKRFSSGIVIMEFRPAKT